MHHPPSAPAPGTAAAHFVGRERGATAVEYGLLLGLVAGGVITVVSGTAARSS